MNKFQICKKSNSEVFLDKYRIIMIKINRNAITILCTIKISRYY